MYIALQQLAYAVAYVQKAAGVWGVAIWRTEMEKRENNSRAVPMLRFGRMVWLKKNTNAGDGLDFNLMQATQMCAGDAVPTLFIPPPLFICIHMTSGLLMLYMIEKQFWSAESLLYLQILGVCCEGELCMGGQKKDIRIWTAGRLLFGGTLYKRYHPSGLNTGWRRHGPNI